MNCLELAFLKSSVSSSSPRTWAEEPVALVREVLCDLVTGAEASPPLSLSGSCWRGTGNG